MASEKLGQRVGSRRNEDMGMSWLADLLHPTIEQLVYIDKTLFNKKTCWRHYAYPPQWN